ncbi:hypothetical protein ACWOEH_05240 [Enterococcus nangangensis]
MTNEPEHKVNTSEDTVPQVEKNPVQPVYIDPTEARKRAKAGYVSARDLYSM